MAQSSLFPAPIYEVHPGDIYQLGRHRLICADATDKVEVARLFAGDKPTMVVTSPPYVNQRKYDREITCWDTMMLSALSDHDYTDDAQILLVLGPLMKNGEWVFYWNKLLQEIKKTGWQLCSQYVWDKKSAFPGNCNGRLGICHEYIFHFRKKSVKVNKLFDCKHAGRIPGGKGMRRKNNALDEKDKMNRIVQTLKISDSVIRTPPEKSNTTSHPATYPIELPRLLIGSWKKIGARSYDPFAGSGTTILAAEKEDVTGLGCEISPAYVAIALARWNKAYPHMPAIKVAL